MIKRIFLGAFLLLTLLNTSCGQIETNNLTKAEEIDELISRYTAYGKFNGTVLVANQGEVIYKKGFGWANMEWDIPNQTDTKFRIASITKQFTAMLIVQLVSENKLDLHVPISTYLPDYPKKNADIITIHHLLTHTSGIPEFDDFVYYRDIERDYYKPQELMKIFEEGELQFTPGEKFAYTNPGYVVLGVIIEKITGESYEQVLQDKILTPLEMHHTGYDNSRTVLKNRAAGYTPMYGRGNYLNVNYIDMSIPYAAGSIYSTVEDLYRWDQALYTEKLVPQKFRDLLFGEYINTAGRHYGYGWFIGEMPIGTSSKKVQTMGHGGGMNGFRTHITRIPSSKSLVVLLSNSERAFLYEMEVAINGILYDEPYDPKKSVAYSLLEVINQEDLATGTEYYMEVKDANGYYLDENEMNIAGYELLWADRLDEALFVLKLNVEAFPNSANVYDSYGEILLLTGKKTEAIENYKKSVEINPKNRNGIKVLSELGVE